MSLHRARNTRFRLAARGPRRVQPYGPRSGNGDLVGDVRDASERASGARRFDAPLRPELAQHGYALCPLRTQYAQFSGNLFALPVVGHVALQIQSARSLIRNCFSTLRKARIRSAYILCFEQVRSASVARNLRMSITCETDRGFYGSV